MQETQDEGPIPGLGKSPGGGYGNPLQYSCLKNPMNMGAWQAIQSMGWQRVRHDWSSLARTQAWQGTEHDSFLKYVRKHKAE